MSPPFTIVPHVLVGFFILFCLPNQLFLLLFSAIYQYHTYERGGSIGLIRSHQRMADAATTIPTVKELSEVKLGEVEGSQSCTEMAASTVEAGPRHVDMMVLSSPQCIFSLSNYTNRNGALAPIPDLFFTRSSCKTGADNSTNIVRY